MRARRLADRAARTGAPASSGAGQTVTRTITAEDGGTATATLRADRHRPGGADCDRRWGQGRQDLQEPAVPACVATDALSGVASSPAKTKVGTTKNAKRKFRVERRGYSTGGQHRDRDRVPTAWLPRSRRRRPRPAGGDTAARVRSPGAWEGVGDGSTGVVGGSTPMDAGSGCTCWSPVRPVHTSAITGRPTGSTTHVSRRRSPHRVHVSWIDRCSRLVLTDRSPRPHLQHGRQRGVRRRVRRDTHKVERSGLPAERRLNRCGEASATALDPGPK